MNIVVKTYCHLNVQRVTATSRHLFFMNRNVLIASNSIACVPSKSATSLTKAAVLRLNSCRLHTFGMLCRSAARCGSKLSVPLSGKYREHCLRHGSVLLAVAFGLLVGCTVLELHRPTVSCVAEAAESTECRQDMKEQTNENCQVVSLEEAIHESDQILQRVKVSGKVTVVFQFILVTFSGQSFRNIALSSCTIWVLFFRRIFPERCVQMFVKFGDSKGSALVHAGNCWLMLFSL